jgi:hypothetical protein
MTESDWLKAAKPEAMLRLVGDRLSPRQWHLLACSVARRIWDAVEPGPLRAAAEWAERHPGETATSPELPGVVAKLEPALRDAAEAARDAQRAIVRAADPDADPDKDFRESDGRKTNPSAPLFQYACRAARSAIAEAERAVTHVHAAVTALVQMPPGPEQLQTVRRQVVEVTTVRAAASLYASSALKLKGFGDEAADADNGRKVGIRYATAMQQVQNEEEQFGTRHADLPAQKERADRKAFGRILHDLVGNPFKPYRFEAAWRTSTVVALAKAIGADRAFDRMSILADALLDADCDEEAVLRHCRGTEPHAPDGPSHGLGCWVIDLILEREPAFFGAPPLAETERPKPPAPPARGRAAPGWAQLLDAIRSGDGDDPDDSEE